MQPPASRSRSRRSLVLSGGGSRGAYEAGFLSYLFEVVYPKLRPDFEFDIISGTSVGAIHAAYVAASSGMPLHERSRRLLATWAQMSLDNVLELDWTDVVGIPIRGLGLGPTRRRGGDANDPEVKGGLVNIAPLERLVKKRIPWAQLRANLAARRPGVLCTAVTDVHSGQVRVFLDGRDADTTPWNYDPHVEAVVTEITDLHVRASAAIPFLFPAVRIADRFYVDGGLRLNTPLSPAVRLQSDKILLVGLKRRVQKRKKPIFADAEALTQPAFLLGKLLDILLLDPIDNELRQLEIVNAILGAGKTLFGGDFAEKIAPAVTAARGVAYRQVDVVMVSPSIDLGRVAADVYHSGRATRPRQSLIASLIERTATRGVPEQEADLLSYIYFDARYTERLIELGREDASAMGDDILALLHEET